MGLLFGVYCSIDHWIFFWSYLRSCPLGLEKDLIFVLSTARRW